MRETSRLAFDKIGFEEEVNTVTVDLSTKPIPWQWRKFKPDEEVPADFESTVVILGVCKDRRSHNIEFTAEYGDTTPEGVCTGCGRVLNPQPSH